MVGYWPSYFVCLWNETKSRYRDQYPTILSKQAWSIKDLLYDQKDAKDNSMICLFSSRLLCFWTLSIERDRKSLG